MEQEATRKDISIFFNFTGISLEMSDPLLSLVSVVQPLLYYDRLSVEAFPTQPELWESHIDSLVSDMKNKLEGRSLSSKDHDGRIRIVVAIDLAKGIIASPSKDGLFFPAQNAKYFKEKIKMAFSEKSYDEEDRLIDRFNYCFVFLDSSNDRQKVPRLYRETAYDGFSLLGGEVDWISADMLNDLDSSSTSDERLEEKMADVSKCLERAGLGEEFKESFRRERSLSKTSNKKLILSIVTSLVGLGCEFFCDSACFLLRIKNSPDEEKCKGEVFFKSLIQLLVTIDDKSFRTNILPEPSMFKPWYFVLDVANGQVDGNIDHNALRKYAGLVEGCGGKMDELSLKKDIRVKFRHFENNAHDPADTDSHKQLNDKLADARLAKKLKYMDDRRVPFFFGKKVGDWDWYNTLLEDVDDIYQFEVDNDRPLYDAPKRLTDSEMKSVVKECSFLELEERKKELEANPPDPVPVENLKRYQDQRHLLMDDFAQAIGDLKKEMVKLGFLSRLMWISVISALVVTLGYTCHYFYNGFEEQAIAIAACFLAVALILFIGALVARGCVKSKIYAVYARIDQDIENLKKGLEKFLKEVYDRVRYQNEADIRKRNLDEMQAKIDEFYGHNKQVEIWKNHYEGMLEKLTRIIDYTSDDRFGCDDDDNPESHITMSLGSKDFRLSGFPYVPYKIRKEFEDMSTTLLSLDGLSVKHVTCFVKKFEFMRHPKKLSL